MVFGSLCFGVFSIKNRTEPRPQSHRTPTRHPPGSIQKPGPEPRPPDPPPGLPRSTNAPRGAGVGTIFDRKCAQTETPENQGNPLPQAKGKHKNSGIPGPKRTEHRYMSDQPFRSVQGDVKTSMLFFDSSFEVLIPPSCRVVRFVLYPLGGRGGAGGPQGGPLGCPPGFPWASPGGTKEKQKNSGIPGLKRT